MFIGYTARMTRTEIAKKRKLFALLLGYWAVGYMGCNWLNTYRGVSYDVSFLFERDIPFIPAFILGYGLVFVSIITLYALSDTIKLFLRAWMGIFTLSTGAFIVFLLFPVQMTLRPEIDSWETRNILDWLAKLYFMIDKPYNAIPSLHVAYPTIATLLLWKTHPHARWFLLAMALITAVSVVFVKQHYIMDVLAGAAAATMAQYVTLKTEPKWRKLFNNSYKFQVTSSKKKQ